MAKKKGKVEVAIAQRKREILEIVCLYFFLWIFMQIALLEILIFKKGFSLVLLLILNVTVFYIYIFKFIFSKKDIDLQISLNGYVKLRCYNACPKLWDAFFSVASSDISKVCLCLDKNRNYDASNLFLGYSQVSLLAVSRGVVEDFSQDEIATLIGHELGHTKGLSVIKQLIGFFDYGVNIFISYFVFVCATSNLAQLVPQDFIKSHSFVVFSSIAIVGFFLIKISMFAWSFVSVLLINYSLRRNEYLADITAVKLTGKPEVFIRSLEKIRKKSLLDSFCVKMGGSSLIGWMLLNGLMTHPTMDDRIAELKRLFVYR